MLATTPPHKFEKSATAGIECADEPVDGCFEAPSVTLSTQPPRPTYSSPFYQPFPLNTPCLFLTRPPRSKKRQRDTLESLPKDCPEDLPSTKRRKRTSEAGTYQWHRPPSFWNRLSKVHLSRGALREFDRRTSRAKQPLLTPRSSINTSSGPGTKSVKRFSTQISGTRVV